MQNYNKFCENYVYKNNYLLKKSDHTGFVL